MLAFAQHSAGKRNAPNIIEEVVRYIAFSCPAGKRTLPVNIRIGALFSNPYRCLSRFFSDLFVQAVLERYQIKLLVFHVQKQEITLWKN